MLFKHRAKRILFLVATSAVILGVVLYVAVPPLAERLIVQRVRQMPGLEGFSFDVRHIGYSGLDVANVTTGKRLFIDGIHVSYSPASLLSGRISGVEVSGLDARAEVSSTGELITDFTPLLNAQKTTETSSAPSLDPTLFSMVPETVQIKNSVVTVVTDKGMVRIPLELVLASQNKGSHFSLQMKFFPFGQILEGAVTAGAETGVESVELKSDKFALTHLQDVLDLVAPGVVLKGRSDLVLSRAGQANWTMSLSALEFSSPMDVRIRDLNCTLTSLSPLGVSGRLKIDHALVKDVAMTFEGGFDSDQRWRLKAGLDSKYSKTLGLFFPGHTIVPTAPGLTVSFQGKGEVGSFDVSGKIDTCQYSGSNSSDLTLNQASSPASSPISNPAPGVDPGVGTGIISNITLKARGDFNLQGKNDILEMGFTAASGPVSFETKDAFVKIPAVTIPGRLIVDSNFVPRVTLTPTFKEATAGLSTHGVEARAISFILPMSLPLDRPRKQGATSGSFTVPTLIHDRQNIGNLKGTIDQVDGGFTARGEVDVKATVSELEISFLAKALATLRFDNNRTRCGLDMTLSRGRVASTEKSFEVSGILARFGSDDLFAMATRPGQVVTADSIRINEIALTDASLGYTLESLDSLLVENIGFNWCGGRVTTESMRIQPREKSYNLTLFCDRLKLSEILRQVGSFEANGEGTVNGRIPVTFSNGDLSFNRGFLFSTPGQGGKISVRGTEILLAGVPAGSAQYTQVDLAREALKDYQYQWAKLLFNTDGETLVVNMAFDGEPENRLPFVYKKEINGFVRVDASSPGSKFQGIRIDVNLEIPFNRVMKFGSMLNKRIQ
ncbi:hypothetical protein HRM2_28560 [Desulforapulum autotrophicum HRM2]|uniref:Uncharacterized protein n=1 Tax=Desulforapulum autotrophicum (strain ATCC 43914 / DSM 3382 / VKM B-1955 / HRM2) TaxID=177437 RepID=C0QJD1_DESAH|nr:YdbH domain-containing protein [Desulforapulum autotrophicum]ACN15944.1 hypothetical protein HRM2_28560 [Desulforapulum autotrophicum HRM2]